VLNSCRTRSNFKPEGSQAVRYDKRLYDHLKLNHKIKKKMVRLSRNRGVPRRNARIKFGPSKNGTEYFTRV